VRGNGDPFGHDATYNYRLAPSIILCPFNPT